MTHLSRSPLWKIIIICLSIAIGAFVAFKFFTPCAQDTAPGEFVTLVEEPAPAVAPEQHEVPAPTQPKVNVATTTQPAPKALVKQPVQKKPQSTKSYKTPDQKPVTKAAEPTKPVEPKVTPKPAPQDVAKPMITVTNNIQKKMTGYRKFGKNWYPDDYSLTINGVQVPEGGQRAVPAGAGNTVNLVFAYDFRPMGKSYKKGTEELSYKLSDDTKALSVTFSWYEKPTLMVK